MIGMKRIKWKNPTLIVNLNLFNGPKTKENKLNQQIQVEYKNRFMFESLAQSIFSFFPHFSSCLKMFKKFKRFLKVESKNIIK